MKWINTEWNEDVTLRPKLLGEFKFNVPQYPGHVNLITKPQGPVSQHAVIAIKYRITGTGYFNSLDTSHGLFPNFRPMLQVANDDWRSPNNRWWPTGSQCINLLVSEGTQFFNLTPGLWSNVYGKADKGAFLRFLPNVAYVSLAFGGGNSFSHGVCAAGGPIKFELLRFKINEH